jgi:hypothetical protein
LPRAAFVVEVLLSKNILKIAFLLIFGLGLCLTSLGSSRAASTQELQAVIRVSKANVRKSPDKYSPRLFSLRRNSKVKILKEREKWLYIATAKGRRGWLFKSLIKIVKPPLIEPEVNFFSNDLKPEQELFFKSLISRMRKKLAHVEARQFGFVVSRIATDTLSDSKAVPAVSWLMLLRVPFSRTLYQQEKGEDLEVGTIDLLLYQKYLKLMLESRDLLFAESTRNPAIWPQLAAHVKSLKILVVLAAGNGDEVALSGFWESAFSIFDDYIILDIHGFSQFSLHSVIPASVADFNKFVLPSPQLPDGSRAPAALAYDFFGCIY